MTGKGFIPQIKSLGTRLGHSLSQTVASRARTGRLTSMILSPLATLAGVALRAVAPDTIFETPSIKGITVTRESHPEGKLEDLVVASRELFDDALAQVQADPQIPPTIAAERFAQEKVQRQTHIATYRDSAGRPIVTLRSEAYTAKNPQTGTVHTYAWLTAIPRTGEGPVTSMEENAGQVIDAIVLEGKVSSPFRGIAVDRLETGGLIILNYDKAGTKGQQVRVSSLSGSFQTASTDRDAAVLESFWGVFRALYMAEGPGDALYVLNTDLYQETVAAGAANAKAFHLVKPLAGMVKHILASEEGSAHDQVLVENAKLVISKIEENTFLPTDVQTEIDELMAGAKALLDEKLQAVTRDDKPVSRPRFYQLLKETESPAEREQLTRELSDQVLTAHRTKGGLFTIIARLNEIARDQGFASFVDMQFALHLKLSRAEFSAQAEAYLAATEPDYQSFLTSIRDGQSEILDIDVAHLAHRKVQAESGLAEEPAMTLAQAKKVAQTFYKDLLGIDIAQMERDGHLIIDMGTRTKKFTESALVPVDYRSALITSPLDPEKLNLKDLAALIHEIAHIITYYLNIEQSGGSPAMGGLLITQWMEAISQATQNLVADQAWLDKYVAHLPQFSPEYRTAYGRYEKGFQLFDNRLKLLRGMAEFVLYEYQDAAGTPISMEARLLRLNELRQQYLGLGGINYNQGGELWATIHLVQPGYFGRVAQYFLSIALGEMAVLPVFDAVVSGQRDQIARRQARLREVLALGARLDNQAKIVQAVERIKSEG
ncbi:MAG: hypothetical protein ABH823_03220 [bacterium]